MMFADREIRALGAAFIGVLCVCSVLNRHSAVASDVPPLPDKKPEFSAPSQTLSMSVMDMASNLLKSENQSVPLPDKKPQFTAKLEASKEIVELYDAYKNKYKTQALSHKDQQLYREIFAAQDMGDVKTADDKIKQLENGRLLGHVLYQRYMHPKAYTSSFEELQQWLALFNAHPNAHKIYALAEKRKPQESNVAIVAPVERRGIARVHEPTMRKAKPYISSKFRTDEEVAEIDAMKRQIVSLVKKGQLQEVSQMLSGEKGTQLLDPVERDILKAEIAAAYMYKGDANNALKLASAVVARSGINAPKAAWVAGLISWQQKKYSNAAKHFETAARSPYASGWLSAAGSYWAARAHMRVGNVKAVSSWLKRGAHYPRTFYGLISTRALGRDFDFNWKVPTFTREMHDLLFSIPSGARAIGLAQAGQYNLSQAELLRIKPESDEQRDAMLAFAGYANLPGLAMRIASASKSSNEGGYYDAALYPVGPWKPKAGFQVSEALVHAIIRQESRFNSDAESPSGAMGLMQLMPATAEYVAGGEEVALDDPEENLELGQRYLKYLLSLSRVDGDLLSLLIAYNAGPGNLGKWKSRWPDVTDPLLFIELLPSSETRAYVERVLSNYWIYRMREGLDTPSLDAIAAGEPAKYASAL